MKGRNTNVRILNNVSYLFRLEGSAEFTFPSGTVYVGNFKDGEFHGHGTLHYTNGAKYEAVWEKGVAIEVEKSFFLY